MKTRYIACDLNGDLLVLYADHDKNYILGYVRYKHKVAYDEFFYWEDIKEVKLSLVDLNYIVKDYIKKGYDYTLSKEYKEKLEKYNSL